MPIKRNEKGLGPRTQLMVNYSFEHPELSRRELANHFGVNPSRISQVLQCDRVLAAYPLLAKRKVKSMVPQAIHRYSKLMAQNDNLEVSRKVSEAVLNASEVLTPMPLIQINLNSQLKDEELLNKIDRVAAIPTKTIDVDLINE